MIVELAPPLLSVPMPRHPRSAGVHVSNIIRAVALQNGSLDPRWVEDLDLSDVSQEQWWAKLDTASKIRISVGLAWEEWYIPQLGDVADHPGEMKVNGIYMTHDGESIDTLLTESGQTPIIALHEVKATYKSTKTVGDLSTCYMWLAQTKAYCKGLNTLVAYIHVLFLCGDYKFPITPQLKKFRVTYTQHEIDDNWEQLVQYARHAKMLEYEDQMRDTE